MPDINDTILSVETTEDDERKEDVTFSVGQEEEGITLTKSETRPYTMVSCIMFTEKDIEYVLSILDSIQVSGGENMMKLGTVYSILKSGTPVPVPAM